MKGVLGKQLRKKVAEGSGEARASRRSANPAGGPDAGGLGVRDAEAVDQGSMAAAGNAAASAALADRFPATHKHMTGPQGGAEKDEASMLAQASSIGSAPARDVPQPPDGWVCPVFEGTSFLPCEGSAQAKERRGSGPGPCGGGQEGRGAGNMLRRVTVGLLAVYTKCTAEFQYQASLNPRRCLTLPKEVEGDGCDNKDSDLVVYVNDELVSTASGRCYVVVDKLGQGTFGQVVKCRLADKAIEFAVKIVRNKQAYTNQALVETMMLSLLNQEKSNHILTYYECFTHKNHLCLVTELLSVNLYELLKQNQFRGLSLNLIRVVLRQCLDALVKLKDKAIVHCDLKPENIMLKSISSPLVKVIDFGSACRESEAIYTYIQSRFYRSPEVLLRLPYDSGIDMWSLGCIAIELFLGLPLWPGTSEHNQMSKIVESLGLPPHHMLQRGRWTDKFFRAESSPDDTIVYTLKTPQEFHADAKDGELPKDRKYFKYSKIDDLIRNFPIKKSLPPEEVEREKDMRRKFSQLLQGILQYDVSERWTAKECLQHPFIQNTPHEAAWAPNRPATRSQGAGVAADSAGNGGRASKAEDTAAGQGSWGGAGGGRVRRRDVDERSDDLDGADRRGLAQVFGLPQAEGGGAGDGGGGGGQTGSSPGGTIHPPWMHGHASLGAQRNLPHWMAGAGAGGGGGRSSLSGSPGGMGLVGGGASPQLGAQVGSWGPYGGAGGGAHTPFGIMGGVGGGGGMSPYGSPGESMGMLAALMQQQSLYGSQGGGNPIMMSPYGSPSLQALPGMSPLNNPWPPGLSCVFVCAC